MKKTVLSQMVNAIVARQNCIKSNNGDWEIRWNNILGNLTKELPRGSGFDSGTEIDLDRSNRNRVYLTTAFHHMNENGFYDEWTSHDIVITPDLLSGFKLSIHGKNKNEIKEYIHETFEFILNKEVEVI